MQKRTLVKIHGAAAYFVFVSTDANEIANVFGVSKDAVWKWARTPEWDEALNALDYTGARQFKQGKTRDALKERPELVEQAHNAYLKAIADGVPKHKLATVAGDAVGLSSRIVRDWARRYSWREGAKPE